MELISIVGPTASGKTALAVALAAELDTEIISADSRQVYRGMDIGTGKDLAEYTHNGKNVPYHLIDILDAGDKYNVFEFQQDFHQVFSNFRENGKVPVLCGGSGMYIESVLRGYRLIRVPENKEFRASLESKSLNELRHILESYGPLHNVSDFDTVKRAVRAIEIADYSQSHTVSYDEFKPVQSLIIGIDTDRELRRNRITQRLRDRLREGMVEEVRALLDKGIRPDDLIYYGLEYKFVTQYLIGQLSYDEMVSQLEIAIHQFAKRQMTWFRGMERRGLKVNWISAELPLADKLQSILALLRNSN